MKLLTPILTLAALATLTTATPTPSTTLSTKYHWNVTSYKSTCDTTTCTYNYTISGPISGKLPGFAAHCSGSDTGEFSACKLLHKATKTTNSTDPSVAAKMDHIKHPDPVSTSPAKIAVQYFFENDGYTYTGFKKAVFDPMLVDGYEFTITPSKATAIGK